MNKAIFLALLLLVSSFSAQAATLHRWPIDYFVYPAEASRWFDHQPTCGYLCRYDGVYNSGGSGHHGTDILGYGSPTIRAGASGNLYYRKSGCGNTWNKNDPCYGYGNHVRIQHSDGKVTIYAHLQSGVAWYQSILCGSSVGTMGNSGTSTGTHLHLEMWSSIYIGQRIDHFGGTYSNGGFSYWVNQNANGYGRPSLSCQ